MLFLLALAAAFAPDGPAPGTEPPEEMIDFLGRRGECMNREPPPGAPADPDSHWAAYRCAALPGEEAALRRRYAGDPAVLAWLDQHPADFRLRRILVSTYDGPPPTRITRSEQSGTDAGGTVPYRLAIEPAGGAVEISLSFSDRPERTLRLGRDHFPWLDPHGATVALQPNGPRRYLRVSFPYGIARRWCGMVEHRARVTIYYFADRGPVVHRSDYANCRSMGEELDPAPFLLPPRGEATGRP